MCLLDYTWVKQYFPFICPFQKFLRSPFTNLADIDGLSKVENKKQSFANNLKSDFSLSGRPFMYTKKRSGPNIEPCETSALNNDHDED